MRQIGHVLVLRVDDVVDVAVAEVQRLGLVPVALLPHEVLGRPDLEDALVELLLGGADVDLLRAGGEDDVEVHAALLVDDFLGPLDLRHVLLLHDVVELAVLDVAEANALDQGARVRFLE